MPRSPGHVFYDKRQAVLIAAGFDAFVETQCAKEYAPRRGRPSLPPGRYFRMLLIGYFEGIDSERGLEWRCTDSLSLREFLRLSEREGVPDHSWLSRTRSRLPLEVHDQVFTWVLERLAEHGLIKGERIGVDASTMEANAALRTIVRRDSGEGYREMLTRMAGESGIETPTAADLVRLDRDRQQAGQCVTAQNAHQTADFFPFAAFSDRAFHHAISAASLNITRTPVPPRLTRTFPPLWALCSASHVTNSGSSAVRPWNSITPATSSTFCLLTIDAS
jgi:transposase